MSNPLINTAKTMHSRNDIILPIKHLCSICCSSKHKGPKLALCSSIIAGFTVPLYKLFFNDGSPVPQVLLVRYFPPIVASLILGVIMKSLTYFKNDNEHRKQWDIFASNMESFKLLSIRSAIHFLSNIFWLWSLSLMPITINLPISQSYPIFSIGIAYFYLKEKITPIDTVLAIIGLLGVCVLSNPTLNMHTISRTNIYGVLLALGCPICYAIQLIILRKHSDKFRWYQTESVVGLLSSFIFIPIMIFISHFIFGTEIINLIEYKNVTMEEFCLYFLTGILEFFSIGMTAAAVMRNDANMAMITIILYGEVFWSILFQWLLLGDTTNFNTYGLWIGLFLIVLSTILISFRKENKENETKQQKENISLVINHKDYGSTHQREI